MKSSINNVKVNIIYFHRHKNLLSARSALICMLSHRRRLVGVLAMSPSLARGGISYVVLHSRHMSTSSAHGPIIVKVREIRRKTSPLASLKQLKAAWNSELSHHGHIETEYRRSSFALLERLEWSTSLLHEHQIPVVLHHLVCSREGIYH